MYRNRKYLDWLREQPCFFTGHTTTEYHAVDPAHIGTAGKGIKSHDFLALPVAHNIHQLAHQKGELSVFMTHLSNNRYAASDALKAVAFVHWLEYELGVSSLSEIAEIIQNVGKQRK